MRIKTITLCLLSFSSFWLGAQTVTTFTGGTPDDAITIDSNGNIYVSQYSGDTVFKFTPSGDVSSFVTGLNTPNGLAFNSNEELFICDGQGNMVYKYDTDGNLLQSFAIDGHPSGIIKDHDSENMIITRYVGNTIIELSPDGTITEISAAEGLNGPVGLAFDENGTLFVGNFTDRDVYKVEADGSIDYIATVGDEGNLGFIDYAHGTLWGTAFQENKIYTINPDGINDTEVFTGSIAGGDDGDISVATFNQPNGILFDDSEDTMYVSDFGSKNLRIISGFTLGFGDTELGSEVLTVVPNPVYDNLQLKGSLLEGTYTVTLYNVLGELLYKESILAIENRTLAEMNISHLSSGIYLVKVSNSGTTITKKLIKK
ncbi:T9SS type A sorting domain-containing protein [Aureisphaera galaxeae]|uniref:virginiamycin B lyase family protein n=1 Tax=Aureisphaera galaxeae TaxID=1538023 RepID=UPI00234FF954|nr:T9SS type A sorting domain-containing protein [Aureisphaera galaxeae]MDC8004007.1 T9SS type A sorting domain-containing protein [Aureisphaera galaxeae]